MKTAGGFLVGILSGAVIGTALGLLFAPEKGEETRSKLAETLEDAKEKVTEALKKRGINLSSDEVEDLVEELKAKVDIEEA